MSDESNKQIKLPTNGHNGNGNGRPDKQDQKRKGGPPETLWKPGQSGNPKGRPKCKTVSELIREALEHKDPEGQYPTMAHRIAATCVAIASAGSHQHLETVLERTEGKVSDHVHSDGKLTIEVTYAKATDPLAARGVPQAHADGTN